MFTTTVVILSGAILVFALIYDVRLAAKKLAAAAETKEKKKKKYKKRRKNGIRKINRRKS